MTIHPAAIDAINTAIAAGQRVVAIHADARRNGQPQPGAEVELTEAFDANGEIRATARGFKGRFRVRRVRIEGTDFQTA